jgi:hypothetical protein
MTDTIRWTTITDAGELSEAVLDNAVEITDSWYPDRIDWTDVLDRLEGMELEDGSRLDLGSDGNSAAIRAIKAHVRKIRRESPR